MKVMLSFFLRLGCCYPEMLERLRESLSCGETTPGSSITTKHPHTHRREFVPVILSVFKLYIFSVCQRVCGEMKARIHRLNYYSHSYMYIQYKKAFVMYPLLPDGSMHRPLSR